MKIVLLDAQTIGDDVDYRSLEELGNFVRYDTSTIEEARERVRDAEIIVTNRVPMGEEVLGAAEQVTCVCVTATGTDMFDLPYLSQRGIRWYNVADYSTESVAQHTFAMLFYLLEHLREYDDFVREGHYRVGNCAYEGRTFRELRGSTWGIIGLGAIGRRVAELAGAFGCRVIYYSTSGENNNPVWERVELSTLLAESDIISIHAALNDDTRDLIGYEEFSRMKKSPLFLNLGRGGLIREEDIVPALEAGFISAVGLDVLQEEPIRPGHPLLQYGEKNRVYITPHIAWASTEARNRVIQIVAGQIRAFAAEEAGERRGRGDRGNRKDERTGGIDR